MGGYLADRFGYTFTFLVTASIQGSATLLQVRVRVRGRGRGYPNPNPNPNPNPHPHPNQAALEVAAIVRSLQAVDTACGLGASAADAEVAAERLEAARNSLREVIALYYGESCIGSPCNGRTGLPRSEAQIDRGA